MKLTITKKVKHQLFAYSLLISLLATFFIFYGNSYFLIEEPGKMSASHAFLGGDCASCHQAADPSFATACLSCHKEIKVAAADFKEKKSGIFHFNQLPAKTCISCHKEHKGENTELILWQFFEHDKSAFKVEGYHRFQNCQACHSNVLKDRDHYRKINQTPEKALYQVEDFSCYGCHKKDDVHRGSKGKNCEKCHPQYLRWNE